MSSPGDEPDRAPSPAGPSDQGGTSVAGTATVHGSRDAARDDLLGYLSRNTMDADYALVAARSAESGRSRDSRGSRWATAVVLAVFLVLVMTLFTQTTQNADSEDNERSQLIGQVGQQQKALGERQGAVARLAASNTRVRAQLLTGTGSGLIGRVERLGLRAGTVAASGPGVLVVVDDAPNAAEARNRVLDSDLQKLINGLWEAGGEAIAINGQRLTNLSSIRQAGAAINVNFVGLSAPYQVEVIGDPDTLPSRFAETTSGATWFDLQQRVGLRFSMSVRSSLELPAAERTPLRYATVIKEGDDS